MADGYASNTHMVLMETGRTSWGSILNANQGLIDALAPVGGCNVVPLETPVSTSLNVAVRPGTYVKSSDGSLNTYAGGTILLAASSTTSLYLNSSGVLTQSVSGFPAGEVVRLAVVTTNGTTVTGITDVRNTLRTTGVSPATTMVASGPTHAGGLVPDTPSTAGTTKFLNEDATWKVIPIMIAAGATHAPGLVPDPSATASTGTSHRFLRDNASWVVPPNFVASGASAAAGYVPTPGTTAGTRRFLREDATWTEPPVFVASGASAAIGYVPSPGTTAGTTRFLKENATWAVPSTFVASGPSHAPGYVPDPPASAGTTKFLREDATWVAITTMVASGASHAGGLVPDTPASAGTLKFLREDATWVVPAGTTVAQFSTFNATAAISTTTLYAPTEAQAFYEISLYASVVALGTSGNLQVDITWPESGFTRTEAAILLPVTPLGYAKATIPCYVSNTGGNIRFAASFTGTAGSVQYHLWITVRKIATP